MAPAGARREARERALELLYESYAKGLSPSDVISGLVIAPDEYAEAAVRGVEARAGEIDGLISTYAKGWTIDRMPVMDRTLLRIAVWELVARSEVPVAVVISEAVELAKRFSTEESGRFVNGLLAAVALSVR
ncbi:MAG TPA: transcription antitermination factor NusB [Acidimicrobiales bacterium]|nr:transcription antitermination factor NusB [Acidimicrobiales bacterium]